MKRRAVAFMWDAAAFGGVGLAGDFQVPHGELDVLSTNKWTADRSGADMDFHKGRLSVYRSGLLMVEAPGFGPYPDGGAAQGDTPNWGLAGDYVIADNGDICFSHKPIDGVEFFQMMW